MNESAKAFLALIIVGCFVFGLLSLDPDVPEGDETLFMIFRIGSPVIGVTCLAILLWGYYRKNKVPDFLSQVSKGYYERDGFCFALVPAIENGVYQMQVYFQNRYDRPSTAQVLICPSSSLARGDARLPEITLGIYCQPGAFGCSIIPWAIPEELQGKTITHRIYAGVKYPQGKGALIRYRDGTNVASIEMDFWSEGLQIYGATLGMFIQSNPTKVEICFPIGVDPSPITEMTAYTETIWKLGDPIPEAVI